MRRALVILILVFLILTVVPAQQLPNLPIPIGAGTAEVWRDTIYYFGGSNDWSGTVLYPRIYKCDGLTWSYHDSIPDNEMWDVESVLVGNEVYLLSGWLSGPHLNRKYNLNTRQWIYMASSPNTQTWGVTADYLDGIIYLFNSTGNVWAYDVAGDQWSTRNSNSATGFWDLSSIMYNNEIYIIGWENQGFYKYTPSSDQWLQLANSPYSVGACAMGIINDSIFCVGGNAGNLPPADYRSVIVYDIPSNSWSTDSARISSRRHWMATAEYKGGLYIIGGIDSLANAVDIVEEVVPQGTAIGIEREDTAIPEHFVLRQNYPNPFNPETRIAFELPKSGPVVLKIYDALGREITTLINQNLVSGGYEVRWEGSDFPGGIYYYQIQAGNFKAARKMILLK